MEAKYKIICTILHFQGAAKVLQCLILNISNFCRQFKKGGKSAESS